jgi:hypothetical protein
MAEPSTAEGSPNAIITEASAFLRTVLERAGSRPVGEAAFLLYPGRLVRPKPEDMLRHMLYVAAAILCDAASVQVTGEPPVDAPEDIDPAEIVQAAERAIAALETASLLDLTEARVHFLEPQWSEELLKQRPLLADLALGILRFMLKCATDCSAERTRRPRSSRNDGP